MQPDHHVLAVRLDFPVMPASLDVAVRRDSFGKFMRTIYQFARVSLLFKTKKGILYEKTKGIGNFQSVHLQLLQKVGEIV